MTTRDEAHAALAAYEEAPRTLPDAPLAAYRCVDALRALLDETEPTPDEREACGDWPGPCNCDEPETHDGALHRQGPITDAQTGAALIAAERERQIRDEGYTAEHDRDHTGDLIAAAVGYAQAGGCDIVASTYPSWVANDPDDPAVDWPWHPSYWKPTGDPVRDLTKAGALIAAAIDSLEAAEAAR